MTKVTFYIDKNNVDSSGFAPIKACVAIDYKRITKTVARVKPRYWNDSQPNEKGNKKSNKQQVKKPLAHEPDNGYAETNTILHNFKSDTELYFLKCDRQKIKITPELVRDYFNGQRINFDVAEKDLWEAYEEFVKDGELMMSANTNRMRKSNKKFLEKFESETCYKMTFDSINMLFFDRLKEYVLNTKSYGYNYLSAIIKRFKAFMAWSQKRKYHNNTEYLDFSAPEKKGSIIHLTNDELQQLINFPFESEKLRKVRDFYCVGCLIGARYCDLKRLTKDNISSGELKFTTEKTNDPVTVPMFPGLKTIIDRYPEQYRLLPKISNQKANKYIKKACEQADIKTLTEVKSFVKNETITEFKPKHELIGTHTARKTFVCLAHASGMDEKTIMSITGIRDQKTLSHYLDVSIDTKKDSLTKMYNGLIPEGEAEPEDETLKAMKETLLKAGFEAEIIEKLLIQETKS